jgi:hypothetical protein
MTMNLTSFVGKLLKEDDADILRDGIQALVDRLSVSPSGCREASAQALCPEPATQSENPW